MKNRTLKKLTSLFLVAIMVAAMIPVALFSASAANVVTYTFSDYDAGTQYAENEEHVLDDNLTVTTTQAHFTTQLRLYSSTSHDSYAIFEASTPISSMVINAGNKVDVLNVYTSTDGSTWELAEAVSITSTSYTDYTVTFSESTSYIKFDVEGTQQVRIAYITVTYDIQDGGSVHSHDYSWNGVVGADGSHTLECSNTDGLCATLTKTENCDWDDGVITSDPDCTSEGEKTFTCTVCGATKTEAVEMTDHNYVDGSCADCGAEEPSTPKYVLTDLADITSDMTVIIVATKDTNAWAMSNDNGTSSAPSAVTVTINGDTITTDATNILWNIANNSGSLTIYPAGQTATYLYCTNANNGVRVGTTTSGVGTFTVDSSTGYLTVATGTTRYLGVYNSQDWRCYTNTTGNTAGQEFAFYVLSTDLSDCDHEWVNNGDPTDPTCTEDGYQPQICTKCGDTKNLAIDATGHTLVDGVCSVCSANFNYTIPEALAAADGTDVIVKGTVSLINEAWSSYNNMSVTIKDADGNELYIFRLYTQVELGDIVTITGKMGTYGGARQIAQGATAVITGHEEVEVVYDEVTIPEAITSDDGRLVTFSGTVTNIANAWNGDNMNLTVTDTEGNTIYLYKLASEVALGDVITVKGIVDTYNSAKQIISATAEVTGNAVTFDGFSLTLNKGVTINVKFTVDSEWVNALASTQLKFNDTSCTILAGTNIYSFDLTPVAIGSSVTFGLYDANGNGTSNDVSVAAYKAKVTAAGAAGTGLSEEKYAKLVELLDKITAYGEAANGATSATETFDGVGDITKNDTNGIFNGMSATLSEQANVKIGITTGDYTGYTLTVTLGEKTLVNGEAFTNYITSENLLVIKNICPANFDDEIVIEISDETGVVASASFTFNAYLKAVYAASDAATQSMIAATYQYGLAANAFAA